MDPSAVATRSLWGIAILALPLVLVVVVVTLYAGMFGLGVRGRAATGPEVVLAFDGCAEAEAVIAARLADMGLPASSAGPLAFRVALPDDADAAAAVPATLAAPGRLEVRGGTELLASSEDVVDASVRMDLMMVPTTLVHVDGDAADRVTRFRRSHRGERFAFAVDGVEVGSLSTDVSLAPGELEIGPPLADGRARWAAVAAWSVQVDHPLPCPITAKAPAPAQEPAGEGPREERAPGPS